MSWFDTNDDGVGDTYAADTNGDGAADTYLVDVGYDGSVDAALGDTNVDGVLDTYLFDTDHDGTFETAQTDSDQNGVIDQAQAPPSGGYYTGETGGAFSSTEMATSPAFTTGASPGGYYTGETGGAWVSGVDSGNSGAGGLVNDPWVNSPRGENGPLNEPGGVPYSSPTHDTNDNGVADGFENDPTSTAPEAYD